MKVVIRRSPPLFVFRREADGLRVLRRLGAMLLFVAALACAYQCFELLTGELAEEAPVPAVALLERWHVWLAAALAAAVASRLAWGQSQRPK